MKKSLLFVLLSMLVSTLLPAQIPDGSIAPDFVGKDLNGKEWRLYDLLAEGKTVILDVSATWCPPCWLYHNSGALKKIYQDYGPQGTNEMMVLFIEGDAKTTTPCLYGESSCVGGTMGNWVNNTPYPIIDDDQIAKLYEISYFPTIFGICPNRRVIELGQIPPSSLYSYAKNCPVAFGNNNAGIFRTNAGTSGSIFCGETAIQPSVEFQNLGNSNMNTAEFSLSINGQIVQTKTWSGNLATFDFGKLTFDPYILTQEDFTDVTITIEKINGQVDENAADNSESSVLLPTLSIVEENMVKLELRTDTRPMETYWEFRNKAGVVMYSGGNTAATPGGLNPNLSGGYGSNQVIKQDLFLPKPDCYEFYILDDGANGLASNAYFKITDNAGNSLIEYSLFDKEYSSWFRAENIPVGVNNLGDEMSVNIQPNPAREVCTVSWENVSFKPTHLILTDATGRVVRRAEILSEHNFIRLPLESLPSGVLSLQLFSEGGLVTSKIINLR